VFHGSLAGEKAACLGRPAVVSAEEVVAHLPSWFVDPERACPATTFYRSVQAHGTLERVDEPAAKARALSALMAKYQPEGRHVPIAADHPLYDTALAGVLVFRVPLARVDGKAKLAQNRGAEERGRLLEGLWRRGDPGDVEALEAIRAACPDTPLPAALAPHAGAALHAALPPEALADAERLLDDAYWWQGTPRELVAVVHRASQAWVGARDGEGRLVATARAVSDGKTAWVYDVAVEPAWRGRGLGKRIVALLLEHPAVRGARTVRLATKDAQGLYAALGFRDHAAVERPFRATEMTLVRR
jgi:ribosomal protein S18 acetylase RimI-like enzyme/nitroimidazol reductase NimA-like FMN-containing flavoprotein (pyridoxamine 5'-phosphate oxidase superfamily)